MSKPTPSGVVAEGPFGREIRLTRALSAEQQTVWAAMTESDRLDRWIGRWEGDPASGRITFFMTSEGDGLEGEEYAIVECDAPHRLSVETATGDETWHLHVELQHDPTDGITTLVFAQPLSDGDMSDVGPGWEYYLDRLVASINGTDPTAVLWDDYYPAMQEHYARLS